MIKVYPDISVVIPVKNEAAKIRACIEGILSQTVPVLEIIVIDSGSTDGTIEILKSYDIVKLLQIPSSEFNHGETRNYGVRHASGDFVILTVGDARPFDNDWIKNLLDGFDDPSVAAVCGQQVCPHEIDKNPIQWFRPVSAPVVKKYSFTKGEFWALSPEQKKAACSWDDVNAMYRLSVLRQIPFQKTSYCEDAIWAREALLAGHTIVYNTAARVFHYHSESMDFTFKVCLTGMYFKYKYMDYIYPAPSFELRKHLSTVKTLLKTKNIGIKEKWNWFLYNVNQYKAGKNAYEVFVTALAKGEEELDEIHQQLCGKPPIPVKQTAHEPAIS
ncbi:MAG: glycosyltransferase [Ferruginibacter sp.]